MAQLDHYQILEVGYEADRDEIRQAYYRLRQACDRTDPQRTRLLSIAFNVLSDPVLRQAYDKEINVRVLILEERQRRGPAPQRRKPKAGHPPTEILSDPGSKPDVDLTGPHRVIPRRRDRTEILGPSQEPEEVVSEAKPPEEILKPSRRVDRTRLRAVEPEPEPVPEPKPEPVAPAFLEIILTDGTRGKHPLNLDRTTIGRATDADIHLDDPEKYISRQHACIMVRAGRYYVVDQDSCNGTRVMGKPITAGVEIALKEGDEIEIEGRRLILRLGSLRRGEQ